MNHNQLKVGDTVFNVKVGWKGYVFDFYISNDLMELMFTNNKTIVRTSKTNYVYSKIVLIEKSYNE